MAHVEAVSDDEVNGWIEVVTSLGPEEVKGGAKEKVEVPLNFSLPEGTKPKSVFLDITVSGVTDKWRVFSGDSSVTKVFKPLLQREYKDEVYSKFVFDVTPIYHIIKSDPVLRVINESNSDIKLMQASLFIIYEYPELGNFRYTYFVSLDLHKSFWSTLNPEKSGYFYGVFKAFPRATLRVKVGECEDTLVVEDINEVLIECNKAKSYYVESDEGSVPLSIIVASYELNLPKIKIEEATFKDGRVKVRLKNLGGDADDVVLLAYLPGRPLARGALGRVRSGEEREASLKVNLEKGSAGVMLRVIWVKGNISDVAAERYLHAR